MTNNLVRLDRLKAYMKLKGYRLQDMMKLLNNSYSVISQKLRGMANFTLCDVVTICREFDISADFLLNLKEEPKFKLGYGEERKKGE